MSRHNNARCAVVTGISDTKNSVAVVVEVSSFCIYTNIQRFTETCFSVEYWNRGVERKNTPDGDINILAQMYVPV